MLMKRRSLPSASQTLARKPEYDSSSRAMISWTVPGSTSKTSASLVILRSGVGIVSLSDIWFLLMKEFVYRLQAEVGMKGSQGSATATNFRLKAVLRTLIEASILVHAFAASPEIACSN